LLPWILPCPEAEAAGFRLCQQVLAFQPLMRAMPILRAFSPKRLVSRLSVRARIIAITLIPVVGFLANGAAYISGEHSVDRAVEDVSRATAFADASREFKTAVGTIQAAARSFAVHPRASDLQTLGDAQAVATTQFGTIRQLSDNDRESNLGAIERTLARLQGNYAELKTEYQRLGGEADAGIRSKLRETAAVAERLIAVDLSRLADGAAQEAAQAQGEAGEHQLVEAFLSMRRFEAAYILDRNFDDREGFNTAFARFNTILDGMHVADDLKARLRQAARSYVDAFETWLATDREIASRVAGIDSDAEFLIRSANANVEGSSVQRERASMVLKSSQARTRSIIIGAGLAAVLLGLAFSWWIGLTITRPLAGLAAVMKRLAEGDTSVQVPATRMRDEIGAMAGAVTVFRDNMIERERLRAARVEANRAREQRGEAIAATITRFEMSVEQALAKVRDTARRLEGASTRLNGAADQVSAEARTAEQRVGSASSNVTNAASSVDELASSMGGIADQATRSTEVAGRVVNEARRTVRTMTELGDAATHIGEAVGLIRAIAAQTNLLALNATIEAARAGESGRGFAVVASEVKSLAGQTHKATEEIAAQVGAIQSAVADAAQAIEQVNEVIEEMSAIASTVAGTVEEQNQAVANIAQGVGLASGEAQSGAEAMSRVAGASNEARATAVDVKALAEVLAAEAEGLDAEVRRFLQDVQAA
jgi:methyl-accepting chemotaxis protein